MMRRGFAFGRTSWPSLLVLSAAFSCARILGFDEGEPFSQNDDVGDGSSPGGHAGMSDPPTAGAPSAGGVSGGVGQGGRTGTGGSSAGESASGGGGTPDCDPELDCENSDTEHCVAHCEGDSCIVVAHDDDEDGFGDERCSAAPGLDCDDARKSVNPEADEICDGRDNDCDGATDFADPEAELALSGELNDLGTGRSLEALAYSPSAREFGAVWLEGSYPNFSISYRLVDLDGNMGDIHAFDGSPPGVTYVALAGSDDASVGGAFALVWAMNTGVALQQLGSDGGPLSPAIPLTSGFPGGVAVADVGDHWAAFWIDLGPEGGMFGRTIEANGTLGSIADFGDSAAQGLGPGSVAVSHGPQDASLFVVYTTVNEAAGLILAPNLVGGEGVEPAIAGTQNTVAARSDSFGTFSTVNETREELRILGRDGQLRCGPLTLPWRATSIAASENGYVILGGGDLLEVSIDCEVVQQATVDNATQLVSAGNDGYLMVGFIPERGLVWRRTGPHFCDSAPR